MVLEGDITGMFVARASSKTHVPPWTADRIPSSVFASWKYLRVLYAGQVKYGAT